MTAGAGGDAFYERWAASGQEAPRSAIARHFAAAFTPGERVLDVGCGMGRDLAVLLDMGVKAYGVEPHAAMRARAIARHPRLEARIAPAALPALGQPFGGGFDGVVCSAVLMHVPPEALPASLAALDAVLVPRARVLMALPRMRTDLLVDGRDPDGREFTNHATADVSSALSDFGFTLLERFAVTSATPDTQWRILLFGRGG